MASSYLLYFYFSCRSDDKVLICSFDLDLVNFVWRFTGVNWISLQVRIQLGQGSAASVTREMLKNEGFGAFYKVGLLIWAYCLCS